MGLSPEGLCLQQQGAGAQAGRHQAGQVGSLEQRHLGYGSLCPLQIVSTQGAAQQRGKRSVVRN